MRTCQICVTTKTDKDTLFVEEGDIFRGTIGINPTITSEYVIFDDICTECLTKLETLFGTDIYADNQNYVARYGYRCAFDSDEEWFNTFIDPYIKKVEAKGKIAVLFSVVPQLYQNFIVLELEQDKLSDLKAFIATIKGKQIAHGLEGDIFRA